LLINLLKLILKSNYYEKSHDSFSIIEELLCTNNNASDGD